MTSKRQLKGKLGHVVKLRVCLLTRPALADHASMGTHAVY